MARRLLNKFPLHTLGRGLLEEMSQIRGRVMDQVEAVRHRGQHLASVR